jgi:hypothetical protein
VQLPAVELTDALLEARLSIREAAGDLELLIESPSSGDVAGPEPRVTMQAADRAMGHLRDAQERLDVLFGTIQEARRLHAPEDSYRTSHPVG